MDYTVDICQLSRDFYTAYPITKYPELMYKDGRPYTCLLIETHEDYLICIPFRSSILHSESFLFAGTVRSSYTRSGLDYKKVVIIKDLKYIDSSTSAIVDNDEYTMMMTNIETIVDEVESYITTYVNHINGNEPMHRREFERRYLYSTLPYFHDVLGLDK